MPSSNANHWGSLARKKAQERYNLERAPPEKREYADLQHKNGKPVNVKASKGDNRFRIWNKDHLKLVAEGGYYVFVQYRPRGRGMEVLNMRKIHAKNVPGSRWYGAGGHRRQQQRKIPPSKLF